MVPSNIRNLTPFHGGNKILPAARKGMGRSTRLLSLTHNLYFLPALVLYGALSLLYVWNLTFTLLSRAYPFVAFCTDACVGSVVVRRARVISSHHWNFADSVRTVSRHWIAEPASRHNCFASAIKT